MASEDKRNFKRYRKDSNFALKFKDRLYNATLVDYSFDGIGVIVRDRDIPQMEKGDVVRFRVDKPRFDTFGEVMWSDRDNSVVRAGLRNVGVLKGQLNDFRLSDVMIGLQRGRKTGILTVECGDIVKKIYIKNGDMIFSSSNQDKDRLGDLLLRNNIITRKQLDDSVTELKKTGKRQGFILVRLGYIKPHELFSAVRNQVEEIIQGLFELEGGRFEFNEMPLPSEEVITLKLSAANLIYHGIRKTRKLHFFQDETPSVGSVLYFSADPLDLFQDLKLDYAGRKIISFIDGKTPVSQIISLAELDGHEAMKTIDALLNIRVVEIKDEHAPSTEWLEEIIQEILKSPKDESGQEAEPEIREMIEDMHRRYEALGYYGVLGIKDNAGLVDIKMAYYKAAKKFHPDMHFHLADDSLKDKLSQIFSYIYEAYATLINPLKRTEYDRLITVKPAKFGAVQDKARALFEEGKALFSKNDFPAAAFRFGQAVYYDETISEYHYYNGLTLAKQSNFKDAERALNKARRLEPHNVAYLNELGFVHLAMNFRARARGLFEKALSISPGNARAAEGLKKTKADYDDRN